jgi:hypothetical protein
MGQKRRLPTSPTNWRGCHSNPPAHLDPHPINAATGTESISGP